jgi:hypothetical protein
MFSKSSRNVGNLFGPVIVVCTPWGWKSDGGPPFLRSCQLCSYSRTSQHFMEAESSLLWSQKPSIGQYPIPGQFNPYHYNLCLRSILILATHLCLCLHRGLHPFDFPASILYTVLSVPNRATCLAQSIFIDVTILITPGKEYRLWRSLLMQFSPTFHHFPSPQTKFSPPHCVSNILSV